MNTVIKKTAGIFLVSAFLLMAAPAFAAPASPELGKLKAGKTSVTIPFTSLELAGKKVKVKVSYRKKGKKERNTITKTEKLNSAGKGTVKVRDLEKNTKYSFKIKIRSTSGDKKYSKYTASVSKKTKR